MKKIALVLCLVLVCGIFAACGKDNTSADSSANEVVSSAVDSEAAVPSDPNPVNIMLMSEDGMDMSEADPSALTGAAKTLYDIYKSTDAAVELPDIMMQPLNDENAESYVGVSADRFAEAVAGDAAIGSLAHSVCIVKANSAEDAEQLKADIEANADPRKWICVEAEKVVVDNVGDTVILIMSDEATAEAIHNAFLATVK